MNIRTYTDVSGTMHHDSAVNLIRWHTKPSLISLLGRKKVDFVSPAVSAVLAASALWNDRIRAIEFDNSECKNYAEITGLMNALAGEIPKCQQGSLHGKTYSPLTRLCTHTDADACNAVIANLLYEQLAGVANKSFVNRVVKVVGELHDNVASHSNGMGFSAAQVYKAGSGSARLEFAIADSGRGMLRNVQRVDGSVTTHAQAIEWCLARGNTTARASCGWEQRLPDDCIVSPLPPGVAGFSSDDHHIGEGLWCLTELARSCGGSVWILSGDSEVIIDRNGKKSVRPVDIDWNGVVIEVEFDIEKSQAIGTAPAQAEARSDLARRLGL